MGLEMTKFEYVRSTILNTEPLPNVNKAYANVVQEERVRNNTREDRPVPMSFVARAGAGTRGSGGERREIPTCTHCKKNGHKIDYCYEIVGFPECYSDRSRSGVGNKGRNSHIAI
ncbi:hypothetical protein RND81_06G131700 [Saponaria officinalis]|uniref:Uncharacterized protein n=1 Tax=Saponaria officinalis TaxID=3572 RepID=A0AAW1K695_SAPOF